mgnify:CR=1 FL=1
MAPEWATSLVCEGLAVTTTLQRVAALPEAALQAGLHEGRVASGVAGSPAPAVWAPVDAHVPMRASVVLKSL